MKLIDVGHVSAVYPERGTARVVFEDKGTVSRELFILVRGSQETKDYWMPAIDEEVVCVFLPNTSKVGFILGSPYNDEDKPPVVSEHKRHLQFSDGTYLEYDQNTKTLTMDVKGEIHLKTTSKIHITTASNVYVTGDVIADGISLKNHTHSGVHGATSAPIGGG